MKIELTMSEIMDLIVACGVAGDEAINEEYYDSYNSLYEKLNVSLDQEKRRLIDEYCDSRTMESSDCWCTAKCPGCPFEHDSEAWCKKGFVSDIKSEDLDSIIQKFRGDIHD